MKDIASVGFIGVLKAAQVLELRKAEADYDLQPAAGENRCGEVAWLEFWTMQAWEIIDHINRNFFDFDIEGVEIPQYAKYREGDYFDWHMDKGPQTPHGARKLSLTVQLSEIDEYVGGKLEIYTGAEIIAAKSAAGSAIAFPSWILHRVTPIKRGIRRALVAWAYGPAFR